MGLFNRNKGDAPAPAAPEAGTSPADNGTFDFDAISRDLDAQNGASSFDALLAAPATNASQTTDNSAFDFPEDPLGLSTPSQSATPATSSVPIAASPDSVLNAPITPTPTTPTTGVAPLEPVAPAPTFTPTETPKAKKSLPLIPLLGALGLLAVAGGGAMFMLNSNQSTEDSAAPMVPPPSGIRRAAPPAGAGAPTAPVAPGAASSPLTPGAPAVITDPRVPLDGPRSASPGIAPATGTAPKPPAPVPGAPTGINASTSQRPAVAPGRGPSATAGLDPALAAKLKQLWKNGAAAKKRGDYNAARAAWTEALRLRPTHPGFQDSIDKLPK